MEGETEEYTYSISNSIETSDALFGMEFEVNESNYDFSIREIAVDLNGKKLKLICVIRL